MLTKLVNMINPDLLKIKLTFRGKDIEIPYHYPCTQGMQYIEILDGKGKEHRFYKGMYSPDIWFAKDTEHWDAEFKRLLQRDRKSVV